MMYARSQTRMGAWTQDWQNHTERVDCWMRDSMYLMGWRAGQTPETGRDTQSQSDLDATLRG